MSIRRNIGMLAALLKIRLIRRIADPMTFWAAFFVDTTVFAIQALVFWILFSNVEELNGWGRWETIFFVGTFSLIDALFMSLYFFGLIALPNTIRTGKLDFHLSKPVDCLLRVAFDGADPGSLFLALPALSLIVFSVMGMGIRPSIGSIMAYGIAIILMLVLFFNLMVIFRVIAFWTTRASTMENLENTLVEFGFRLPGRVWQGGLKLVFCVFLPYGLIATFPTEAFLGSAGGLMWLNALGVCFTFTLLARIAWKIGLKRYVGTGS